MEHVKQESVIHHTIHTHYTYDLNIKDPSNTAQVTCNYQDWNIYALEWSEDKLTFFVNGQETFSYSNLKLENEAEMKQWPFTKDSSFYLILNMGLGETDRAHGQVLSMMPTYLPSWKLTG